MPSLGHPLVSIEARDEDAGSTTLSTGGIVGVAIAGAFIVFAALSLLLILVARRQSRRRWLAEQAESGTTGSPSQNGSEEKSPFPRRLRKKSIFDAEGSPEPIPEWHRISLPIIPPVFSRRPSMNLAPFRDVHSSGGQSQRTEKERGRELREIRRKSSWIDEDALHGPRISKPRSKPSLLSLRRKLSFRQPSANLILGSPTLPHAQHKPNPIPTESIGAAQTTTVTRSSSSGTVLYGPRPTPQALSATQPSPPASQEPLAATQTTRATNHIVFEAAHQLAGQSRLPNSQRPPRNCTSATGLSDILQLTATRLQDGNMSARRQTMFAENTATKSQQIVRFEGVYVEDSDAISPTRSQKSAPEVVELEAKEMTPRKGLALGPLQKPNHDRHVSHVSQFSIVSEADSLVVSNRNSQPDVQTPLSSPSRHERAKELAQAEQAQELRPTTSGSESSALSTLYSVDEEAEATQTMGAVIEHIVDAPTGQQSHEGSMDPDLCLAPNLRRCLPAPEERTEKPLETSLQFSIYTVQDDPFIAEPSPSQNSPNLSQVFKILPGNVKRAETGSKSRDSIRIVDYKPAVRVTKATATPTPPAKSLRITLPPPYVLRPGSPTPDASDRRPSPTLSSHSIGSSANESSSNGDRNSVSGGMGYSTTTLLTVPSPEGSPTKSDERPGSRTGFHCNLSTATDDELDNEERDLPSYKNNKSKPGSRLLVQQTRLPSDSSVYSQEEGEEEDRLPPLRSAGNRDSAQIASVVAELRRMNSQISQASGYSMASTASSNTLVATTIPEEVGSPTLPALRGGGFSPGKKGGPSGASRNYLAVGSPGKRRPHDDGKECRRGSGGGGKSGATGRRSRRGRCVPVWALGRGWRTGSRSWIGIWLVCPGRRVPNDPAGTAR
ncbi:hypothetical protein PG985_013781 [Apiospora marii]|uniref:uncharacterized protein n=1 Tax=Apiospora marii TaxID=335849 RepID=UPI00312E14CE